MQIKNPSRATVTMEPSDRHWRALVERDKAYDGTFFYGVSTTGIYCRPSCASRAPKRDNVVIFARPADAEAQGFRACKRCRPSVGESATEEMVARARTIIDQRLEADPDARLKLGELAAEVGWSVGHLQRTFTRMVGVSPRAYVDARRTEQAKRALRQGDTVLDATFEGGFGSGKALYERADKALGMRPGTYRRGGKGLSIRYALFDTALGVVLVAATEHGVCAVSLDDQAQYLEDELRRDFHAAAELTRDDEALGPWAEPILRMLAGAPGTSFTHAARALLSLPVDARGTIFQQRVWSALREIPPGETRTYTQVAAMIDKPKAVRAVARACATNPVSLLVPCHRVIGSKGGLRGYRWGLERKRQLLEMEAS